MYADGEARKHVFSGFASLCLKTDLYKLTMPTIYHPWGKIKFGHNLLTLRTWTLLIWPFSKRAINEDIKTVLETSLKQSITGQ